LFVEFLLLLCVTISLLSKCEEGIHASFKVFTAVFKGSEVHES